MATEPAPHYLPLQNAFAALLLDSDSDGQRSDTDGEDQLDPSHEGAPDWGTLDPYSDSDYGCCWAAVEKVSPPSGQTDHESDSPPSGQTDPDTGVREISIGNNNEIRPDNMCQNIRGKDNVDNHRNRKMYKTKDGVYMAKQGFLGVIEALSKSGSSKPSGPAVAGKDAEVNALEGLTGAEARKICENRAV